MHGEWSSAGGDKVRKTVLGRAGVVGGWGNREGSGYSHPRSTQPDRRARGGCARRGRRLGVLPSCALPRVEATRSRTRPTGLGAGRRRVRRSLRQPTTRAGRGRRARVGEVAGLRERGARFGRGLPGGPHQRLRTRTSREGELRDPHPAGPPQGRRARPRGQAQVHQEAQQPRCRGRPPPS